MSDLPIFRRDVLMKAFNGEVRLVSAFEELVQYVLDAAAQAQSGATVANVLSGASLLTLGTADGLDSARILSPGLGVALDDAEGLLTIRLTDLTPKITGSFPVNFIVTGATNLILPTLGTVATLADVAAAVAGAVTSFNTRTGDVVLTSGDVTTALGYTPTSVTGLTGIQSVAAFKIGLTLVKADVGLGSVDNTADAAKNVLTATKLLTARAISITGDGAWTVNFDGSAAVTAALTLATVNATVGSFGGAGKTITATVNAKGLVTAFAETAIAITASQVTDFSEATDDRVAALVQNGTGITWTYNDAGGTLTPTVTITQYTDEMAQDAIGTMIDASLVYVDATPLLTRAALTGDATAAQGSNALTFATVNSNVGAFGSATQAATFTVNAKGLTTAAANVTITPAVGSITGLGTGVATALAVNIGSAGAFVTFNGALGTPSSGTLTNATGLPIAGLVASTVTAIGVGTIELGHASDTTIARSGAGDITIEGKGVYRADGTDVPVPDGGTGRSTSTTAYGLLAAGTTATGAHQTLAAGATTEVLVGGGASALPAWTTATGTGAPVRAGSPTLTGTALFTSLSGQDIALSAGIIASGAAYVFARSTSGIRVQDAGAVTKGFIYFDGGIFGMLRSDGGTIWSAPLGSSNVTFAGTIDVTGESRCDSLRIDVAPTAATPVPTHTFPVSLNGTTYRVPCVI